MNKPLNHPTLNLPPVAAIAGETAQECAYRRLRHALMVGAIPPGRPLTIRGLAAVFGLSPTPVREALRRLSSENALSVLGNRRIQVAPMTAQRFEELVSLRCTVEAHAAERAISYVSDALIEALSALDQRLDAAIAAQDYDRIAILNQRFHSSIYRANPHEVAMPLVESIWLQLGPFNRVAAHYISEHYLVDRHAEILDAMRARDPIAISVAVEADIRDGVGRMGRTALRKILGGENPGPTAN
ncbi:GntR family transcriptional regulator [Brevirhabdus sp.]|uniref:GntR family transcriptional regulator n=1 Tax=Brevirhabdus sp. TaxID=2004514 RepID=UPI0040592A73